MKAPGPADGEGGPREGPDLAVRAAQVAYRTCERLCGTAVQREDVAQEAALRVLDGRAVPPPGAVREAFFAGVARNIVREWTRRRRKEADGVRHLVVAAREADGKLSRWSVPAEPPAEAETPSSSACLAPVVWAGLTTREAEALRLRVEGRSDRAAARIRGISRAAYRERVARAIRRGRRALELGSTSACPASREAVPPCHDPVTAKIAALHDQGRTAAQIGEELGLSAPAVRQRLYRLRCKARAHRVRLEGCAVLLPLLALRRGVSRVGAQWIAASGGAIVTAKTVVAAAVVVLVLALGVGVLVTTRRAKERHPAAASPEAHAVPRPRTRVAEEKATGLPGAPAPSAPEVAPVAVPTQPAPPTRPLAERLADRHPPVDFAEEPLLSVLGRISADADIPIGIAREVEAKVREAKVGRLTLRVSVPAQELLDTVLQFQGLGSAVVDDQLVVIPREGDWNRKGPFVAVPPPDSAVPRTLRIRGRVVDVDGAAVPGARINRVLREEFELATAASDGTYSADVPRPFGLVEARAPGHAASQAVELVGRVGDEVAGLDLTLGGPGGVLEVRVIDDTYGSPVAANVEVVLGRRDAGEIAGMRAFGSRDRSAKANPFGLVLFEGLPPQRANVRASAQGFERAEAIVSIAASQRSRVEVRMRRETPLAKRLGEARISFAFEKTSAKAVVDYIAMVAGISVVIEPASAERVEAVAITLSVREERIGTALHDVCAQAGLEIEERDGTLWLTTPKR